jgi:hypothetical protein
MRMGIQIQMGVAKKIFAEEKVGIKKNNQEYRESPFTSLHYLQTFIG